MLSRRDSARLLPIIEDFVAGLLDRFQVSLLDWDHVLPPPLSLLNVLLDALKFVLEGREELRVAVVEEFAILVFRLVFFNFGLLIGQASTFYSHTKINCTKCKLNFNRFSINQKKILSGFSDPSDKLESDQKLSDRANMRL